LFLWRRNPLHAPAVLSANEEIRMVSWLELLLNIVGYGGFVVLATWHPRSRVEDPSHQIGPDESRSAMR
jgi:hypothetical protein